MDDFHNPKPHGSPEKSTVSSVLAWLSDKGESVLSLLSGLLAAVLILYSGYVLYDTFYTQNQAFSSSWDLLQYKPTIISDGATPLSGTDKLAEINRDYRAWLTMYDTNIDYPVMQGPDDLYYASHDIYGESSLTGAIYLAAGSSSDLSDSYNLIYGHHMDNGAMFGGLDEFTDAGYFASHREGILVSSTRIYDLTTFAVAETDAYESEIYSVGPSRDMNEVVSFLREGSEKTKTRIFDEDALVGATKIVAMSTCASAETNGRLVVFCVMDVRSVISLTLEGYEGMYDAQSHSIAAVPSIAEGSLVEYSTDGGVTWSTEPPSILNVGTVEVIARVTNDDYGRATATATLTVTPRPAVVTAIDAGKVYGTPDPGFAATVEGIIDDYRLSYTVTRPGAGVDENVGVYPDAILPAGEALQGNYTVTYVPATFTITPAAMSVTAIGYEGVYDGAAHFGSAVPSVLEGTTLEYRLPGSEVWSTQPPEILHVGSQPFEVRAVNPNYVTVTAEAVLTVTPRPVTVTADPASKVFGEKDPSFSAAVSGLLGSDTVSYTVTRPGVGTDEAVGVYPGAILPAGEELQGDYIVSFIPADFTITAAGVLTVVGIDYLGVYDAHAHPARATVNIVRGTTIEFSLDGESWSRSAPTITDVGSFTVYVRATNPSYPTATASLTLTVTPLPVTVTANPASKVYGTEDPAFSAYVSGVIDGYEIAYTVSRPGAGTDEAAGSYPGAIVPAGAAAQGNYTVSYIPADFTITTAEMTLTAEGYEGVYDAETHTLRAEPSVTEGTTLSYSTDGGQTWTREAPEIIDVGSLIVLVRAENPNYETVTASVVLTVTPRPVTVAAVNAFKTVGEDDPAFAANVTGLIDDFQIVYTVTRFGAGTDEAVGTYEGVVIPAGETLQGNYTVTYVPASFTILPLTIPEPTPTPAPTPTPEIIPEPDIPLVDFFEPKGTNSPAWALVNLLCVIATAYLLLPLMHLKDKFGRSKLMKQINEAKQEYRSALELQEQEEREKLRINRFAAAEKARQAEDATPESIEAAVRAAEALGFAEVTGEEFDDAVSELYYKLKKFLKRLRSGLVLEALDTVAAIVAFILTEDMRSPMILIDKWTPLMLLLLLICWVIDVRLARYREKLLAEEEEKKEEAEKQAAAAQ